MPDLIAWDTELLIHSYFNIVKREMIDMVPKAISLTLVNFSKENLQRELLQELYKPDVLEELLKESEYTVARRKEVISMVQALNKAEEYVPITCLRDGRLIFFLFPGLLPVCKVLFFPCAAPDCCAMKLVCAI